MTYEQFLLAVGALLGLSLEDATSTVTASYAVVLQSLADSVAKDPSAKSYDLILPNIGSLVVVRNDEDDGRCTYNLKLEYEFDQLANNILNNDDSGTMIAKSLKSLDTKIKGEVDDKLRKATGAEGDPISELLGPKY